MRTFNPNGNYLIYHENKILKTRQFKNEQSLILYGNTLANKKKGTIYIIESSAQKNNFWQFFK